MGGDEMQCSQAHQLVQARVYICLSVCLSMSVSERKERLNETIQFSFR